MKIVADVCGGDRPPDEILRGCAAALKTEPRLRLIICGPGDEIRNAMTRAGFPAERYEIAHCEGVVTGEESPTEAIRKKPDSSLVKALDYLKNDPEAAGLVSCGSTGALLTGGILKIGRIKGISRPALAAVLPALNGGNVLLIDCGANMDCKPVNIAHFAMMGDAYMRAVYALKKPRVALMSVGTEDKKGNEASRAAFDIMKKLPLNFTGNMEARDCLSGNYDVLAADGFAGNVALKSMEGAVKAAMDVFKGALRGGIKSKIGAAFIGGKLRKAAARLDYRNGGGAPLLGLSKTVIKAHGSSKGENICAALLQAVRMADNKIIERIKAGLADMPANVIENG